MQGSSAECELCMSCSTCNDVSLRLSVRTVFLITSAAKPDLWTNRRGQEACIHSIRRCLTCMHACFLQCHSHHVCTVQRILNVEYGFPPHIRTSNDCKDLMKRILVADPSKRISIPQIMQHPWSASPACLLAILTFACMLRACSCMLAHACLLSACLLLHTSFLFATHPHVFFCAVAFCVVRNQHKPVSKTIS